MAIRYDERLVDRIRRTVKNYQSKRKRVAERGTGFIPEPAYVKAFLTGYTNRRTLIKDLSALERYSKRGSEEFITFESGVTTSRYEIAELKRKVALSKRNITLQIKHADDITRLQPLARSYYEHLEAEYEYLSRPIKELSKRQFTTFTRIAAGESNLEHKRQIFYENIHIMLNEVAFGLPPDLAEQLRRAFDSKSMDQLVDLMQTDTNVRSLMDYYAVIKGGGKVGSDMEFQTQIKAIIEYLNEL